jgi:hypothetical protein
VRRSDRPDASTASTFPRACFGSAQAERSSSLDQHPLNRRRCRQLCRAGAPRWRPLQFVIQHDAASSDCVTPDLETASSGRPPGHLHHHLSDADAYRDDRRASSAFLLPDRCMLFTAMAGVPDLSAMSRSCSSMMARAGAPRCAFPPWLSWLWVLRWSHLRLQRLRLLAVVSWPLRLRENLGLLIGSLARTEPVGASVAVAG